MGENGQSKPSFLRHRFPHGGRMSTTPAPLAGLGSMRDVRDPQLTTWTALALILAIYAGGFLAGIHSGIWAINHGAPSLDYSTARGVNLVIGQIGGIAITLAVLYLIRRWLTIPAPLAGLTSRRHAVLPVIWTVYASVVGMFFAQTILNALTQNLAATNQPVIVNAWTWLGTITALNAGVVEEVTIVAIPVLLGRRAGWSPAAIIALSIALRYPFHVYHGPLAAIPWTIIWAGANCAAYLYFRRLWPLVFMHAVADISIAVVAPYTGAGGAQLFLIATLLLGGSYLAIRATAERCRNYPSLRTLPKDARAMLDATRRADRIFTTMSVAVCIIGPIVTLVAAGWIPAAVIAVCCAFFAAVLVVTYLRVADTHISRDTHGALTGLTRYQIRATGDTTVSNPIGVADLEGALPAIAQAAVAEHPDGAIVYQSFNRDDPTLAQIAQISGLTPVKLRRWRTRWELRIPYRHLDHPPGEQAEYMPVK